MNTRSMTRNTRAIVEFAMTPHNVVSECVCDNHNHSHKNTVNILKDKYEVDINFDEASRSWKINKESIGFGSYKYTGCIYKFKNGHICGKEPVYDTNYCIVHLARTNIDNQFIDIVKKMIDTTNK